MRTQLGILCLVIALAGPASAQGGPAGPLLGSPTETDFQAWSQRSAADRLAAYEALSPADRQLVDQRVGGWVVEQCNRELAAGNSLAFKNLGDSLNLVPAIALEPEPEAKARLVGDAFSTVIAANHIDTYDTGRTDEARSGVENPGDNAAAVIGRGGGTCGELSWALSDTLAGAFKGQAPNERPFPANGHAIDVEPVFGYGTWVTGGVPVVGGLESAVVGLKFNHAGVRIEIDGRVLACDPAWFLKQNQGRSLSGFSSSGWYLMPFDRFLDHWKSSAAWGAWITEWESESGVQNDALRLARTKPPARRDETIVLPALAVVLAPGERVTFTAPPGAQRYQWRVKGTLGVLESPSGSSYDLQTGLSNTVTYVATTVRPGAFDSLEVEVMTGQGKVSFLRAQATIVTGFDARVAPGEQTVERGASICFGVADVPEHLRARDLTARWHVPGAFGVLEAVELRGSELATYTCTSAPAGGGQEAITCELFLAGRQVASASGTVRVLPEGEEPPAPAPGGAFSYEGTWTVTATAVGQWEYRRWFVYDQPIGAVVASEEGGLEPTPATETFTTSFTVTDEEVVGFSSTVTPAGGGDGWFRLRVPGSEPDSEGEHGSVWLLGRAQELRTDARLSTFISGADRGWSLFLEVNEGTSTLTPDRRHFTGTEGTFRLAPDQNVALVGEVRNAGNQYAGRYTNWIKSFRSTGEVQYSVTRTGDAR